MSAATSGTLSAERVISVFEDCLSIHKVAGQNTIMAEGIMINVFFDRKKVEEHRQEIHEMLADLPDNFKSSGGGGYSFLNMCLDRHGTQWTGIHETQEQLVQLGIAIGEVEYCLPRDYWPAFPGGVPYLTVKQ